MATMVGIFWAVKCDWTDGFIAFRMTVEVTLTKK
jgi:hypothetical protein